MYHLTQIINLYIILYKLLIHHISFSPFLSLKKYRQSASEPSRRLFRIRGELYLRLATEFVSSYFIDSSRCWIYCDGSDVAIMKIIDS